MPAALSRFRRFFFSLLFAVRWMQIEANTNLRLVFLSVLCFAHTHARTKQQLPDSSDRTSPATYWDRRAQPPS